MLMGVITNYLSDVVYGEVMYTSKISYFFCLILAASVCMAGPGGLGGSGGQGGGSGRSFSEPFRNRSNVQIPSSCVIKAKAIVSASSMGASDLAASQAFLNVLSSAGSTISVDYVLTPNLVQQGVGTSNNPAPPQGNAIGNPGTTPSLATTEISLKGYLGTVQISLIQASGNTYVTSQVFDSLSTAQATASSSVATNLIQKNSNQATVSMDVIATDIQKFFTSIGISSDLQGQSSIDISTGGAGTASNLGGVPTVLGHALTLADIISHIDVKATVTFDGTNLTIVAPKTNLGC